MEGMRRSRSGVRWVRIVALGALIGGLVAYGLASDAEATAIERSGGEAGLWSVGLMLGIVLFMPGAGLLGWSLVVSARSRAGAFTGALAGAALLGPTAWLALNLYPPDREIDERRPLEPARWDHVADLYLLALVLLATAGVLLLASAARSVVPAEGRLRDRG